MTEEKGANPLPEEAQQPEEARQPAETQDKQEKATSSEETSPQTKWTLWAHIRGLLVLFHVVAVAVLALPNPSLTLNRRAWRQPTVQQEFRIWAKNLRSFGIKLTPKQLENELWKLAKKAMKWHGKLVAPFFPYERYIGAQQNWFMFVAPHRYPSRLSIELAGADKKWRPIYIARSPKYNWRGQQLDHDRVRAALFRYGWRSYYSTFKKFSKWLAKRAKKDFPKAHKIRMRMYRYRTLTPKEVYKGKKPRGKYHSTLVFDLRKLR